MGFFSQLPKGREKSRLDVRSGEGCVGIGTGAVGRLDAALSGPFDPAPLGFGTACCCAKPCGKQDARVRTTVATARSLPPATSLRFSLRLCFACRPRGIAFLYRMARSSRHTAFSKKCMVPLKEKIVEKFGWHSERQSSRRPSSSSGCKNLVYQTIIAVKSIRKSHTWLRNRYPARSLDGRSPQVFPYFAFRSRQRLRLVPVRACVRPSLSPAGPGCSCYRDAARTGFAPKMIQHRRNNRLHGLRAQGDDSGAWNIGLNPFVEPYGQRFDDQAVDGQRRNVHSPSHAYQEISHYKKHVLHSGKLPFSSRRRGDENMRWSAFN